MRTTFQKLKSGKGRKAGGLGSSSPRQRLPGGLGACTVDSEGGADRGAELWGGAGGKAAFLGWAKVLDQGRKQAEVSSWAPLFQISLQGNPPGLRERLQDLPQSS